MLIMMINPGRAIHNNHVPPLCDQSQAPFFCPLVAVELAAGFSEFSILRYMPLIAGTVTPGRGQWLLIV